MATDMKYVYVLGDHDEYSTEHVKATLDRDKVLDLLKTYETFVDERVKFKTDSYYEAAVKRNEDSNKEMTDTLKMLLGKSDEELSTKDGYQLNSGWGGVIFYVIELE